MSHIQTSEGWNRGETDVAYVELVRTLVVHVHPPNSIHLTVYNFELWHMTTHFTVYFVGFAV